MAKDGTIFWSTIEADIAEAHPVTASAKLNVRFPKIDWVSLRSAYGWSILQYQAWARGFLVIKDVVKQTLLLYTDNVLEFWIDDEPYFGGDYYAYRNAPLLLQLPPGHHKVDVRLIYDVRAMGGQGDPEVEALLHVQRSRCSLAVDGEKLLVSDVVDGLLASNLACVPIRNESTKWLDIWGVSSVEASPRWIHLTCLIR